MASVVPVAHSGEVTCDDVDLAGANVRSYVHYVSLNVGTTNDSASAYGEMTAAFQPSTDSAAIAAQKEALTALNEAGAVVWTAMGNDPADWDTTLRFTE